MIHYLQESVKKGPHTTKIDSKTAHLKQGKVGVRAVVLSEEEFTQENVENLLKNKVTGLIALIKGENFVPSKSWNQAYTFLRKFYYFKSCTVGD